MKNAIFNEPRFQQTVSRGYYGSLEVIFGFIYQLTNDSSSILEIVACYKAKYRNFIFNSNTTFSSATL